MLVRKGMSRCPEVARARACLRGGGGRDTGNQRHASYGDLTLQKHAKTNGFLNGLRDQNPDPGVARGDPVCRGAGGRAGGGVWAGGWES